MQHILFLRSLLPAKHKTNNSAARRSKKRSRICTTSSLAAIGRQLVNKPVQCPNNYKLIIHVIYIYIYIYNDIYIYKWYIWCTVHISLTRHVGGTPGRLSWSIRRSITRCEMEVINRPYNSQQLWRFPAELLEIISNNSGFSGKVDIAIENGHL